MSDNAKQRKIGESGSAERLMASWMCGVSLKKEYHSKGQDVVCDEDVVKCGGWRLKLFGHLERRGTGECVCL